VFNALTVRDPRLIVTDGVYEKGIGDGCFANAWRAGDKYRLPLALGCFGEQLL
jgi:hypothetical protein